VAITPTRPLLGQARAPLPEAALAACYVRLAARRSPRGDRLWGQLGGPGPASGSATLSSASSRASRRATCCKMFMKSPG